MGDNEKKVLVMEDTELAFIQCPGCRSLLPAVATRCRMCGYSLEERGKGATAADDAEKKSRVRQRTVSIAGEDLKEFKEKIETADSSGTHRPEAFSFDLAVDEDNHDDEISLAGGEIPARSISKPTSEPGFTTQHSRPAVAGIEEGSPFRLGTQARDVVFSQQSDRNPSEAPSWPGEVSKGLNEPNEGKVLAEISSGKERNGAAQETRPAEFESVEDFQVADESGPTNDESAEGKKKRRRRRRRRKKSETNPLEATSNSGANAEREAVLEEFVEADSMKIKESTHLESSKEQRLAHEHELAQVQLEATLERENVREIKVEKVFENQEKEMEAIEETAEMTPQKPLKTQNKPSSVATGGSSSEGVLVGWLVNYDDDPKGSAAELRSGRFFVSSERVRESDMLISDSSLSTPHCMMKASEDEGLIVQDLMSAHGTFVRRSGEKSYSQYSEAIEVFHGDWIRFGNYEVMVCLLPLSK